MALQKRYYVTIAHLAVLATYETREAAEAAAREAVEGGYLAVEVAEVVKRFSAPPPEGPPPVRVETYT